MPRKEDIERFTQVLNSLGDEPAIRAARAQTIEEVPPPVEDEQGESGGVDSLPGGTESDGTEGQEGLQDFFSDLSALPEDAATAGDIPSPQVDASTSPEAPAPEDNLDFASLFGDEAEPQAIEDIKQPVPDRAPRAAQTVEPEPSADAFSLPEGELEGLQADLTGMEALPEDLGEPAGPIEDADIGSTEPPEDLFAEPSGERAEPAAEEPADSFELPALDDLSFTEPESAAVPADESSEQATDDSPFAEPTAAAPEAEDSSELPSFDLDGATLADAEPAAAEEALESTGDEQLPSGPAMESLGEESLGDLNLDEFSLPESAEEFGLGEPTPPAPPPRAPAPRERRRPARPAPAPAAVPITATEEPAEEGELSLTAEQFAQLKTALDALPRNLKIVVQDLIGLGTATGAGLRQLIDALLRGASAQEIATLAGRISGKRIRVPAGYEKRTGVAFEAEQRTFRYAFRENILPILRVVLITLIAGGMFGFLGYNYVYRPLSATTNYRVGYAQIADNRFVLANERFDRAVSIWPMKKWFYRFAEGFAGKRQFVLAEEKYEQLLQRYGNDKKAILDYAHMESASLGDYKKADDLLNRILGTSMYDYEALLASGDNDLEWADSVPDKYAATRLAYATLIERYGAKDELLFRMLRYFIRTDNGTEVERLRAYYATRPDIKVDAGVYAELGGYLVDHRRLDYAQDVLFRADKTHPGLYEVHYNLARYYRIVQNADNEKLALDETLRLLSSSDPLTRKRLSIEIDTHTRLGEYYYKTKEYIAAEKDLQTALRLIEQNQKNKLIGKDREFGRAYMDMGDMYYYIQGDLTLADSNYQSAIVNLYSDPELTYKIGYIQYAEADFKSSLATFTDAEEASAYPSGNEAEAPAAGSAAVDAVTRLPGEVPQNLLFALGNSFYQRGDFFAAQGSYLRLLDRLNTRRAAIGTLHPEDTPSDRLLADMIVKVNNNLGVTMTRLATRTGDRGKRSQAMVYLTEAAQLADQLNRSPDTVQRSDTRSIPSLNMRGILYPLTNFQLQLYATLPKDFEAVSW